MTLIDQTNLLNHLISKSVDAERNYKKALYHTSNEKLRQQIKESLQRQIFFRDQLASFVLDLFGSIDEEKSILENTSSLQIDLKAILTSEEENTLLKGVIKLEHCLLANYEEVIAKLPLSVSYYFSLVSQRNVIRSTIKKINNLQMIPEKV